MSLSQTREKQERWEKMSNLTLAGDYKGTGTQQWFQGAENAPYFWFIKTAVEKHQVTSWLLLGRWGALGVKGGSTSADCPVCGPPTSLQRFRPFYLLCDCPPAIPTGHSPSVWRMKAADFFFTPVGWQASLGHSTAISLRQRPALPFPHVLHPKTEKTSELTGCPDESGCAWSSGRFEDCCLQKCQGRGTKGTELGITARSAKWMFL